jgi:hypothetical protein
VRDEVCPEIAKTSAFGVSLACLIGKSMLLGASGAERRFIGPKSDPNVQFGCVGQKLMHYSGEIWYMSLLLTAFKIWREV